MIMPGAKLAYRRHRPIWEWRRFQRFSVRWLVALALGSVFNPAHAEILPVQCEVSPPDKRLGDGRLTIDTTTRRARLGEGKAFEVNVEAGLIVGASQHGEILRFDRKALEGSVDTHGGEFFFKNCKRLR